MCGIVGYIGEQPTKNFIIDGLKKLEYRGYDSAGAFLFNNEGYLRKCKGKVADLEKKMNDDIRILLTEYRQKRKGNFNSNIRRISELERNDK